MRQRIQPQCQTVFYDLECRASHSIQFRSNRGTAGGEHQLQRLPVVTVIPELAQLCVSGFLVMHQIQFAVCGLGEERHQERVTSPGHRHDVR